MSDARARGWGWPGAPGSAQDRMYQRDHIVTITLNCGVKLRVRREVSALFKGFFDELEAETGYSLADKGVPDDWGFNNRDIRGRPGVKSNHAWGLAVDGNSEENPMGNPRRTDYPVKKTQALADRWGLFWGFNYQSRPDTMHFEFLGTPADVSRYPLGSKPKPVPEPIPPEEEEVKPYLFVNDLKELFIVTGNKVVRVLPPFEDAYKKRFGEPLPGNNEQLDHYMIQFGQK